MRFWSDIPSAQRLPVKRLERMYTWPGSERLLAEKKALMVNPRCHVAVRWGAYWMPCSMRPKKGEDLCRHHGGSPPVVRMEHLVLDGPWAGLPARLANCFKRAGIKTRDELARMTDDRMLAIRNFGTASLVAVREWLSFQELEEERHYAGLVDLQ